MPIDVTQEQWLRALEFAKQNPRLFHPNQIEGISSRIIWPEYVNKPVDVNTMTKHELEELHTRQFLNM